MIIEYSIALLEKLKLTPNEHFIIILLKNKEFGILKNFLDTNYTQIQLEELVQSFIKRKLFTSTTIFNSTMDLSKLRISNELYSLLKTDDMFEEFLEAYPKSVVRTDGVVDYLRTDQKSCRMMYLLYTKLNRAKHEHILKCLLFEVEKRNRDGSMKFMVRMSKWLTTEAWKAYEDEINNISVKPTTYGTDVE